MKPSSGVSEAWSLRLIPCKLQTFGSQVIWQPRPFVLCALGGLIPLVRNYEIQSFSKRCTFPLPCTGSVRAESRASTEGPRTCTHAGSSCPGPRIAWQPLVSAGPATPGKKSSHFLVVWRLFLI